MPEDGFTGGIGVGEEADGGEEGQEYDEHDYDAAAHEPGRDFADQAAHFFRTEVDVGGPPNTGMVVRSQTKEVRSRKLEGQVPSSSWFLTRL